MSERLPPALRYPEMKKPKSMVPQETFPIKAPRGHITYVTKGEIERLLRLGWELIDESPRQS